MSEADYLTADEIESQRLLSPPEQTSYHTSPAVETADARRKWEKVSCCSNITNKIRSYFVYHLICFITHYTAFAVALFSIVSQFIRQHGKNLNIGASVGLAVFALISIVVDIYLLREHYQKKTYFPYCAAPHLLYMRKEIRVDPTTPPNDTLYLTDKLLIFFQGYMIVVVPFAHLLTSTKHSDGSRLSSLEQVVLIAIAVQLVLSLVNWLLFIAFYFVFVVECLLRFFCFFCCLYRPRHNSSPVPTDEHILASHSSDPIFYKPYEWLYANM